MKTYSIILTVIMLSLSTINAQVTEVEKPMSMGLKNALVTTFRDIKQNKLEDLWEDYVKQFDTKAKKDKKMDEYYVPSAHVFYIPGAATTDIYARFLELGSTIEGSFFFITNGSFVSSTSNAEQMKGGQEFVRQFVVYVDKYKTNLVMEGEQKTLKKLESDLKKLARDNENLHKDIENYKEKIRKAEEAIVKNVTDQENTNKMINEQAKKVDVIKSQLDALK